MQERRPLIDDEVMRRLGLFFEKAAGLLRGAVRSGSPILIRFNNDADGVSGGLLISRALVRLGARPLDRQNNSALYAYGDASVDINALRNISEEKKPVIVIIDFGANEESVEALELLHSAGAAIVIIDHHPPARRAVELADAFVSPWAVEGGNSNYTAGLLAGEVAGRLGEEEVVQLQLVSLIGDRSRLIDQTAQPHELRRIAMVFDYISADPRLPQTLEFYEQVLGNKRKTDSLLSQASAKMAKALELARAHSRKRRLPNGIFLAVINLDKVLRPGEFPPKGKVVGTLHDELVEREKGPVIAIGHGERIISIRANPEAVRAGFRASHVIAELKEELTNAIESGGGHDVAASIRVNEGFGKLVLDELLRKIGELPRQ